MMRKWISNSSAGDGDICRGVGGCLGVATGVVYRILSSATFLIAAATSIKGFSGLLLSSWQIIKVISLSIKLGEKDKMRNP